MTIQESPALPAYDHRAGTGPTLVFLHYWGGSSRTWGPIVERLAERDVLTIDFRGWSRSRHLSGPYTLQQLADDTVAILNEAQVQEYVLVGHSMGGKVAQLIASTRPAGLRGVVLVGSGPATPAPEITPEYRQGLSHAYDSVESVAGARDAILSATPLNAQYKSQVLEDSSASANDEARTYWPLRGIAEDIHEQTQNISVPVLVVAGERDQVEPVAVLESNLLPFLPSAELLIIPAVGHLIPLEASDALSKVITEFVDSAVRR